MPKNMIVIERNYRAGRSISLTPLIDVVFLLMVFFILTTNYVDIEALKLGILDEDMSASSSDEQVSQTQELVLLGSGAVFLNNKLIYYGRLEDALEVIFTKMPGALMRIRSDEKVSVQLLVDVLDMVKRSGGKDVTVARWKNTRKGW